MICTYNVDLDNLVEHNTALFNRTYGGVKNILKTSVDRNSPIEVIITAPTKLVTTKTGDSTLTTGAGIVSDFKERDDDNWWVHSLVWLLKNGDVRLGTRSVNMSTLTNHVQSIPPKKRVY